MCVCVCVSCVSLQVDSAADLIEKASRLHNVHIDRVSVMKDKYQWHGQSEAPALRAALAIVRALPRAPCSLIVDGWEATPAVLGELQHLPQWQELSLCLVMHAESVLGSLIIPHSYAMVNLMCVTEEEAEAIVAGLVQGRLEGLSITIRLSREHQEWVERYRPRISEQPHIALACYEYNLVL